MFNLRIGSVSGRTINRKLTPEERQFLIQKLSHRQSRIRWMAANALGKLKVQEAIDPLIYSLNDPHWLVRLHVATALGRLGNVKAELPLQRALVDPSFPVRRRVIAALSAIGDERTLPIVLRQLRADRRVWVLVNQNLVKFMSPQAAYRLSRAVTTGKREWAGSRLSKWGSGLTSFLLQILKYNNMAVKRAVVPLIGRLGDERAVESLNQLLSSENTPWQIRSAAGSAIGDIEARKFEWLLQEV